MKLQQSLITVGIVILALFIYDRFVKPMSVGA